MSDKHRGPRWQALRDVWGVALLLALVLGGIYGGVFTATEGAGIGASGSFFFALARRALSLKILYGVLVESTRTTAMLFSAFFNFTTMPSDLKEWILQQGLSTLMVVASMMVIYVVFGTIM